MGGAALPAIMGAQAVGGGVSAWAQGQEAKAAGSYYDYVGDTAKTNARISRTAAKSQATEVSVQEGAEARAVTESVKRTVAAQKAAFVSGGPGAGSKTAEQIVSDSLARGDLDQMAVRYNADIKRKGIETGADFRDIEYDGQVKSAGMSKNNAQFAAKVGQVSTILGTGTSVAKTWYSGQR